MARGISVLSLILAANAYGPTQCAGADLAFQQIYAFPTTSPGPHGAATRLVEAPDGSFYGTTTYGGPQGLGTIFRIWPTGDLTTLFSFSGTNGQFPFGGLVLGTDGYFYGTTRTDDRITPFGTVFRMTADGNLQTLLSFQGTNGSNPNGSLEPGPDGNFYGTTFDGGAFGLGTCFVVSSNGTLATLISFDGTNGSNPSSALVAGGDGTFYGTTWCGGSNFNGQYTGNGTVFRITTNGALTTLVYFSLTNGAKPMAGLSRGSDGNFYGTTGRGGANDSGTIFKLTPEGLLTTLVEFGPTGGIWPYSGVTQGSDGSFYGTTSYRLENSIRTNGTLFRVTTNSVLTTLLNLDGTNGIHPFTDLILASDGNLYGTMADITAYFPVNGGTVFRLVPPPVLTDISSTNGSTTVSWSSFSNGVYRVERNVSLVGTNWAPRSTVTAHGPTCSYTESSPGTTNGFYRVVLLP